MSECHWDFLALIYGLRFFLMKFNCKMFSICLFTQWYWLSKFEFWFLVCKFGFGLWYQNLNLAEILAHCRKPIEPTTLCNCALWWVGLTVIWRLQFCKEFAMKHRAYFHHWSFFFSFFFKNLFNGLWTVVIG